MAAQSKWEARTKKIPTLESAWKQLGTLAAEQTSLTPKLKTISAIRVDGDPSPASLEVQVWNAGNSKSKSKGWQISRQWGRGMNSAVRR